MMVDSEETIAERAVKLLSDNHLNMAVAESCTGGMIGKVITDIPGSSSVLWGGFILYSNEAKIHLANVDREIIDSHGAVSRETVEAMASGTREKCRTDFAVSVSGIAGPGGGTAEKPVGTVWIGLASQGHVESRLFQFTGDRDSIRKKTVTEALKMLCTNMEQTAPKNN